MHLRPSLFVPAQAWLFLALPLLGCTESHPPSPAASAAASVVVAPAAPSASAVELAPSASAAAPTREIAGAAQIVVAYTGAELAAKTVTRTKDDAKKRATEALDKIKKDKMPFEEAAKKYSDDAGSKDLGGAIGNFERNAMPAAFSTATFALKVGDISDVVETPRGFHIIKRTR
jgi:hypothetical protein